MSDTTNRLNIAYADARRVFDVALTNGGARVAFDTAGQAVHFRQRAYTYRKKLRAANAAPEYERIIMTIERNEVLIRISRPEPAILPLNEGEEIIEPTPQVSEEEAELLGSLHLDINFGDENEK